jgi:hypothetical protein
MRGEKPVDVLLVRSLFPSLPLSANILVSLVYPSVLFPQLRIQRLIDENYRSHMASFFAVSGSAGSAYRLITLSGRCSTPAKLPF